MPKQPTGCVEWRVDPEDGVEKWHARVRTSAGRPTLKIEGVPQDQPELARATANAEAIEALDPYYRAHACADGFIALSRRAVLIRKS